MLVSRNQNKQTKTHLYRETRKEIQILNSTYISKQGTSKMKEKTSWFHAMKIYFTRLLEEAFILAKRAINIYPSFLGDIDTHDMLKPYYYLVNAEFYSTNNNVVS